MKRLTKVSMLTAGAALMFALTPPAAFAADTAIDATNFPDPVFRTKVSTLADTNHDGKLSDTEIAAVASIDVHGQSVTNLQGIQFFTALAGLNCANNELKTLDLTQNTELTWLKCDSNQLKTLDLTQNTKLISLIVGSNFMTALDLSKNPALKEFKVDTNQLTNLKLQLNPYITTADLTSQTVEVEADKNTRQLDLSQFAGFDVSKASNWVNAAVTGNTLTVSDGKDEVTYDYNTDFPGALADAKALKVTLKVKFVDKGGAAAIPNERIAGANRVATSLAGFGKATNKSTVVLATGQNFPDGLTGGALAGALKGAVVLTSAPSLEPEVLTALKNAGTNKVYIAGGPGAVSVQKENALQAAGMTTVRLAGADRYATAKAVVAETKKVLSTTKVAMLAIGSNFPDALAASAAAARMGGVVDLVAPGTPANADSDATKTYCVGGPACANAAAGVQKVIGADRIATAFELSKLTPPTTNAMVAYANNFPDALSAGGLAASLDANLFLSSGANATVPTGTAKVYLIGGTGVLPSSIGFTTK